jgi:preprotein translocase subunit SecE
MFGSSGGDCGVTLRTGVYIVVAKKDEAALPETKSGFNLGTFFRETKEELDKVVWPSRQQLISESLAVILMVTLSATLIYLLDQLFTWAAKQVFG